MAITKQSIGAHLVGLPPAAQRGLHNLFNHLFDEIEQLRGGAPKAEVTPPSSDVLPPVVPLAASNADPLPAEPELTNADAAADLAGEPRPDHPGLAPASTDTAAAGDAANAADAPADLPSAA